MFADLGHFTQLSIQVDFMALFLNFESFCVLLLAFPETLHVFFVSLAADCIHIRCLPVANPCIHGSSRVSI